MDDDFKIDEAHDAIEAEAEMVDQSRHRDPRAEPSFGDEFDVIITDNKAGKDNDPISQVAGRITFVRFPGDYTPEPAERVPVRVVEVSENYIVAAAIDWEGRDA